MGVFYIYFPTVQKLDFPYQIKEEGLNMCINTLLIFILLPRDSNSHLSSGYTYHLKMHIDKKN